NGQFMYAYQYKDHLGNIRLSYADINDNGVIEAATEILEENNYYPFGLKHQGYNSIANNNRNEAAEKYKYNGKEYEDALGLNIYEMDLRQYDPAIGRWTVQDPVIHHEFSPYSAFDNNPVYWADPSGADAVPVSVMDLFNAAEGDITTFTFVNGSLIGTETYMVEELLQNLYELRPLEGTEYEGSKGSAYGGGGGGHGKGGGHANDGTTSTTHHLLTKLWWHFQFGERKDFNLNASLLDFSYTNQQELGIAESLKIGQKIGVNLFNAGITEYSLAFGKLSMIYLGNNLFRIESNKFDFDYQSKSSFSRNLGTFIGSFMVGDHFEIPAGLWGLVRNSNGIGGGFMINFMGNVYIPE